jgi:hypothetical protein
MTELPKEQRIAKHKSFLNANGLRIAAFAWEHYLTKGRGAVLVPESEFLYEDIPQLKGIRFHYLAQTEREQPAFKDILAEKELAWMETYDPDEKVILCIIREGGGISSYLFGGRIKNSEAYTRQKTAMSN